MTASRIEDLMGVETEHLLGLATGLPLVKIRASSADTVLIGQVEPALARQIAMHLLESAARAEYEQDLMTGAKALGLTESEAAAAMHAVRRGEFHRHTGTPES